MDKVFREKLSLTNNLILPYVEFLEQFIKVRCSSFVMYKKEKRK